jgi:16S rRNA (cytosine1402-N4)-methyltransferase
MKEWQHIPVLAGKIADLLITDLNGVYIDGTLGLGGHGGVLLSRLGPKAVLLGFDKDPKALDMAVKNINDPRLKVFNASYLEAPRVLETLGIEGAAGALFDLGLSSYQLDDASRGFGFMRDGPLDMRFDNTKGQSAADIVNTWPADKIECALRTYGEESATRKISLAIYEARRAAPLTTTAQLAKVIERAQPRFGKIHPATKTFQALRILVNDEIAAVEKLPPLQPRILAPKGRAAFLTFHSTEDRIIKNGLKRLASGDNWALINKKVIQPGCEEIKANPRSRSAKLRVIERPEQGPKAAPAGERV